MVMFLLSVSPLTSAYSTYTLCAVQTIPPLPPPCPTAQLTIAYQTADEESAPPLLSAISHFCPLVDLGAMSMGSYVMMRGCLCARVLCACVLARSSTSMCECLIACMGAWVPMCLRMWVHGYVLGLLRA